MPGDMDLIRRAQAGGEDGREALGELVSRHRGFIVLSIQRGLRRIGPVPERIIDEFFGSAVAVFIRNVQLFDPSKNANLLTYAGIGIERKVWRELDRRALIRVPVRERDGQGRFAADVERSRRIVPLHKPVGRGGDGDGGRHECDIASLIPGRGQDVPEAAAESEDRARRITRVRGAIAILPANLRSMLQARMRGLTLEQAGEEAGVSLERARQIEAMAMYLVARMFGVTLQDKYTRSLGAQARQELERKVLAAAKRRGRVRARGTRGVRG